jgi:hypothetical protein
MKAYGLRSKLRYNYTDCHPKKLGKGWVNWWEAELNSVKNKKSARQLVKKIIKNSLNL